MLCSIFGGLVLLQLVSAGGYAPPPPVQPSASAYGSPQSFGYGHNSYGMLKYFQNGILDDEFQHFRQKFPIILMRDSK